MVRRARPKKRRTKSGFEWRFPEVAKLPLDEDLVATGADLRPGTLLSAYSSGYFPMPISRDRIGWFHPNPRGILPVKGMRVSKTLRRSIRRYTTTIDTAFEEVIHACADPSRPGSWIDEPIIEGYLELHRLGHAHSVEVWDDEGLAGGLYGLSIGRFWSGESMFHRRTDASKVALVRLVEVLDEVKALHDVQWVTAHMEKMGAVPISRMEYSATLQEAIAEPAPVEFSIPSDM